VTLIVRDQGPGLPESVRDFYRRPALSGLPPRDNIGLGVWTVCLLTSRLGGRIETENNDPMGTTILVALPIEKEVRLVAVA
ncbi:MAG TPA: ATP-binding protein, partial [Candidatus Acidoferrum sp.]|nr:ATP-binding protein [Candidatus Acidoferrum sp.]